MDTLLALVGFAFVSSVTPGPNNLLLWASGAEFGVRRTLRHVVGTAIGIGLMAVSVAAGLGAVIATVPEVATAMKLAGSVYLLYLAYRKALQRGAVAKPMSLLQAAAFQVINPKAWIFALGAITTFRPADTPVLLGSVLVAITMMLVVLPTAALWAIAGGSLSRLMAGHRWSRPVSLGLAVMLAATVVYVWI